jgi:short-subunit dehydrogenase
MDRKTALITGSSKGLGKELALQFSRTGYDLILHGRNALDLLDIEKEIAKNGANSYTVIGDLSFSKTLDTLAEVAHNKNIQVLVNNAGAYLNKQINEMTSEELRGIMETNFFAPAILTQKILPEFLRNKEGLIVNINSLAGQQGSLGESAYCASKHALRGYSDSLKFEAIKNGIKILDVYIAAMKTQMTQKRGNYDLLIDPKEAAEIIMSNCKDYKSINIDEIHLKRAKYS